MVILDEKSMLPPPPSYTSSTTNPPPFPGQAYVPPNLARLPAYILLHIVYKTFPQEAGIHLNEDRLELQRKTLYWLAISLRLVSRSIYIACMHVLRSTYLPAYTSLIKPPYTSDPFPLTSTQASSSSPSSHLPSPLISLQRETQVLDLFLSVKVREDVWIDDSELHLERHETFRDLFDLMQPRSRMEDLVRHYGVRDGVVSVSSGSSMPGTPTSPALAKGAHISSLPFSALTVSFSPRTVGLVLNSRGTKRTIVEIPRTRDEKLEISAKKLVKELKRWLA